MSILDWIEILSDLLETEREELSMFCQEKHLSAWDVLFNEEDEASAMYILKEWNIEISRNIDWEKVILWEVHSEEILWEMALFWEEWNRMATAIALEDTSLITILSFSIKDLTEKHPELLNKIKSIINSREQNNASM